MQLTLNEIQATGDESLEWKSLLEDKIDKEEYVEINEHDLEKQLHNLQENFQIMRMQCIDNKRQLEVENSSLKEELAKIRKKLAIETKRLEII